MAQLIKVFDGMFIDYNDFGAFVAASIPIVGPAGSGANWIFGDDVTFVTDLLSLNIQNLSGDTIDIRSQAFAIATAGYQLVHQATVTIDCSDATEDTIYVTNVGAAAGNVRIAVWAGRSSD